MMSPSGFRRADARNMDRASVNSRLISAGWSGSYRLSQGFSSYVGIPPPIACPQRLGVATALVGQHGPLVAAQFGVLLLEFLAGAPLLAQLAQVLGVPLVGAAPGLRHLLLRRPGTGPPAQRDPGRDLVADLPASRARLPGAVGD